MLQKVITCLKNHKLWAYFAISLIFFGIFLELDFATDTYADVMSDPQGIITNFLQGGRFITVSCFVIVRLLHLGLRVTYLLSYFLAIVSLTFALYLLEKLIREHLIKNSVWAFLLPILLIVNPFIIELFLYIEKGIMLFGILCCVIATYFYVQFLEKPHKKTLLPSALFSILAAISYQGVVGLLIVLMTIFTIIKAKDFKTFFKNTCISVGLYAIGPIVDLLLIKLFSSGGRTSGGIILSESLRKIFHGAANMLGTFNILPALTFACVVLAIIIFWLVALLRQRQLFTKNAGLTFLMLCYIAVVTILAALAPQVMQSTSAIWVVARSTYVFASLPAVLLTIILARHTKIILSESIINGGLLAVSIALLILQFYRFNSISIDHYNVNALDRARAEQIATIISDYETKNNTTVTHIMTTADATPTWSYPGNFVSGDINVSSFVTSWSDVNSINYWSGRNFIRQNADEDWSNYCAKHNWNYLDEEQFQFDGTTLKICLY